MTRKEEEEVLRHTLERYGVEHQALVTAEECGELVKAVSKAIRYGVSHPCAKLPESFKGDIAEEIADVQIMTGQMMIAYGISEAEVSEQREIKYRRLKKEEEAAKRSEQQ